MPIRECYRGTLELEKNVIHWFFSKGRPRPRLTLIIRTTYSLSKVVAFRICGERLVRRWHLTGFILRGKPNGRTVVPSPCCTSNFCQEHLCPPKEISCLSGTLPGCRPISLGDWVWAQERTLAAESIVRSAKTGKPSAAFLEAIEPILDTIRRLCTVQDELGNACHTGPGAERSPYWLLTERHLLSKPNRIETEEGTAPHKRSITSCWVSS